MLKRLIQYPNKSFFLFGARGTGKSTFIKSEFSDKRTRYINLLQMDEERYYMQNPSRLRAEVLALPEEVSHVVIDEIQKIPRLLDEVHYLIEETNKQFVLTGSSARKLKRGAANLLAGRARVRYLYPFSFVELGERFDLEKTLHFGSLPEVSLEEDPLENADYLRAYVHVYLKEEIWAEHFIRKLEPFQYFLEVAAQMNGKPINRSKIAREVGVSDQTVSDYFSILTDTLIGFTLPGFDHSFRKRLLKSEKFYYFDCGIMKALKGTLTLPVNKKTYEYGHTFEHFIVIECLKLASYFYPDYRFSHLRTKENHEIDLVVERPGQPYIMIKIKSNNVIDDDDLKHLKNIAESFTEPAEFVCFADVKHILQYDKITVYPWKEGIKHYFLEKR